MRLVSRTFTQIGPETFDTHAEALSFFFDRNALVVLGDPGAGKSTSFRFAAEDEANAICVSVRDFLALTPARWKGKTLYLDGLDEQRAKSTDGTAVLDQVRSRLEQLGRPRFRLSCRAADWYGDSDADRLRLVSPDETITVLRVDPLNDDDILDAVSDELPDPKTFLAEARRRQIHELLTNPQTLSLILSVVVGGSWPDTKSDLFNRSCSILANEYNDEHVRGQAIPFTAEDIISAAGYLCTVQLCAGLAGFALSRRQADNSYPQIDAPGQNQQLLAAVLRRRIFTSSGIERVSPIHRTIAEYLSAKYLIKRIRDGLPVGRVLALVTGYDGGTLSDLRGLFAWLACLCTEHAASLIPRDPLGIVLYGDPPVLTASVKRLVIENLAKQSRQNPWFRSENWASQPFGGLASPDMEPVFRDILQDSSQHPVLVSCVLDAVAYGQPLSNLAELLIAVVRDNERSTFIRADALLALQNAQPNSIQILKNLLDDINSGIISDEDCRLRGKLLPLLYPKVIGPNRIANFLTSEPPNYYGEYSHFLDRQLVQNTPSDALPALLDEIVKSAQIRERTHQYTWKRFLGRLLVRGLQEHGGRIATTKLYDWLGTVLDEHGSPNAETEHTDAIRQWLEQQPSVIYELFCYWLSLTRPENLRFEEYLFWQRLHNVKLPPGFARPLLEKAKGETDENVADFLFREAVRMRTEREQPDAPTIDEILKYAETNIRFRETLRLEFYCEIPEWRLKNIQRRQRDRHERETARQARIEWLSRDTKKIREGTSENLIFLAKLYFALFSDVDREASPFERLVTATNKAIAEAALQGFSAALRRGKLPTPEAIGELYSKSRYYNIGHVVLAGMDEFASRTLTELNTLPASTRGAALAFHYTTTTGNDRVWLQHLLISEPKLAARALRAFWRPQLARRAQHIPGLYELAHQDYMTDVAQLAAIPLLHAYPSCGTQNFDNLMRAAIRHGDRNQLIKLAHQVLSKQSRATGAHKALWYTYAYLLKPEKYRGRIARFIGKDPLKAYTLLQIAFPSWSKGRNPEILPHAKDLALVITVAGRMLKPGDTEPKEHEPGGSYKVTKQMEAARTLHSLIQNLGNDVSVEATDALTLLIRDTKLAAWREPLAHAAALQARRRREAQFRYPTAREVAAALGQGQPVNSPDLQAIVAHHFRTLGEELHHGPTDGFKALWNVDSHGKPTTPRPENDCRDRLLDRLRPELSRLSINAEPEGHYARDKRADIKALCGSMNLPVEIKRHYHKDLWTAPMEQLKKLYSRDPGTGGRGIYLVLWFGLDLKSFPRPPSGIPSPERPKDLEVALKELLPENERVLLEMIVLDCSRVTR